VGKLEGKGQLNHDRRDLDEDIKMNLKDRVRGFVRACGVCVCARARAHTHTHTQL